MKGLHIQLITSLTNNIFVLLIEYTLLLVSSYEVLGCFVQVARCLTFRLRLSKKTSGWKFYVWSICHHNFHDIRCFSSHSLKVNGSKLDTWKHLFLACDMKNDYDSSQSSRATCSKHQY